MTSIWNRLAAGHGLAAAVSVEHGSMVIAADGELDVASVEPSRRDRAAAGGATTTSDHDVHDGHLT